MATYDFKSNRPSFINTLPSKEALPVVNGRVKVICPKCKDERKVLAKYLAVADGLCGKCSHLMGLSLTEHYKNKKAERGV